MILPYLGLDFVGYSIRPSRIDDDPPSGGRTAEEVIIRIIDDDFRDVHYHSQSYILPDTVQRRLVLVHHFDDIVHVGVLRFGDGA